MKFGTYITTIYRTVAHKCKRHFHFSRGDKIILPPTLKEQIQDLRRSRIVIIGGHYNWANKLKRIFPDWDYIATDSFSTQTAAIVGRRIESGGSGELFPA